MTVYNIVISLPPRKFVTFLYTASQFFTMDTLPRTFYFPDTMMDNWPWPRVLNPHYEAMKLEVEAWRYDFKALGPEVHEAFDKCDIGLTYLTSP